MKLCPFSKYKDIAGKLGTGFHKYRLKGTSILDYLFTIAFAFLVTYLTNIPLVLTTIGLLLLGIIFHTLFGVETYSVKYLGLTC